MSLTIAIDVRSLMEGRYSGVEVYTSQIIRAMQQVAPQHRYIFFYNAAKAVTLPSMGSSATIATTRYPNKVFNTLQASLNWPQWDKLVPADCFFVPSFRLLPVSPGVPVVTTVHDLSFERFPELFSWRRRLWHRLMRPRSLMANSTHLIAVSQATADDLGSLYLIPPDKMTVVHSGIKVPDVTERNSIQYIRGRYKLPRQFILYIGTLEPRKNIPGLIRAFSAVASQINQDLVIAGPRGWKLREIDQAIASSKYRHRIHVTGFVAEEDKFSLYAAADLFVYPSFYEGFGFPPLEALLSGTPVITSYNSSLPEIVGEWSTLCNPDDPAELALLIKELVQNKQRIPTEIQQRIRHHYSWQVAASKTLKIIEAAAQTKDRHSDI